MKKTVSTAVQLGSILLAVCTLLVSLSGCLSGAGDAETSADTPPAASDPHSPDMSPAGAEDTGANTRSAFDVAGEIGAGWNLGNALDCIDNKKRGLISELDGVTPEEFYETYWGNPVTTADMIDTVAKSGFGAIRVPVTYADHMDEDYRISPDWLDRVRQIVNYVLDNDIYCIINLHHDTGSGTWPWLRADPSSAGQMERNLRTVWLQIAEYFREYGDKLLFESFNEILDAESRWGGASNAAYDVVNSLNQVFVDTVRGTGGNNSDRYLIVKTYAAGAASDILDAFVLPEDSADGHLLVGIHYYGVRLFFSRQENVNRTETYSDWDYQRDGKPVEDFFERINRRFIEKNIPVIVCEFGAQNKGNTADRTGYAGHYAEAAMKYGIACLWWDDGGRAGNADAVTGYAIFDRAQNRWYFPDIAEAMISSAKAAFSAPGANPLQ